MPPVNVAAALADSRNRFVLQYAPDDRARSVFYCVVRAGHGQPRAGDVIERDTYPGHEIVLCLSGTAEVRLAGRNHRVGPGQAIWVNCHHPHRYHADAQEPWEYLWIRFEGPHLDHIWEMLLEAGGPVVGGCDDKAKVEIYQRIFALLREQPPAVDPLIHAEVARLIALMLHGLHSTGRPPQDLANVPDHLRPALERMRLFHHLPLRVTELAELAGVSESHFIRSFRKATGTSPIDWLRRERITQAKRRLVETGDPIKQIARQVGYSDQFYFSRDFKQFTGRTPTEYREGERRRA